MKPQTLSLLVTAAPSTVTIVNIYLFDDDFLSFWLFLSFPTPAPTSLHLLVIDPPTLGFSLTSQKSSLSLPSQFFCISTSLAHLLLFILPRFTPNLMKCNHLSPTALCLCSWTKSQSQNWGPQQSTLRCFPFPAVRQLFPPFSTKPPDPLFLLPFRPCVLLRWNKMKERRNQPRTSIGSLPHLLPSVLCSFILQGIKTKSP